jgi:hypothetical protein
MKRVYYTTKDIYGYVSFEDYRDLKYGVTKTIIVHCNRTSYIVSLNEIKEETLSDQ